MTMLDATHDPALACIIPAAQDESTDFPIQNLPFGVFRQAGSTQAFRGGVAIGDQIVDLARIHAAGRLEGPAAEAAEAACDPTLNRLAALGPGPRNALRQALSRALSGAGPDVAEALVPQHAAEMDLPMRIGDYSDFLANIEHAVNAGRQFRPDEPVRPNYRHIPIAYHGRASSIRVSGTPCIRPYGQIQQGEGAPVFAPSGALDYELELAFYIGQGTRFGHPVSLDQAPDHIFGLCLLNDWSARDLQRWEYQPLGPFLSKSFQSNVSAWVVTPEALMPFRTAWRGRQEDEPAPLPYLASAANAAHGGYDIQVAAALSSRQMQAEGHAPLPVSHSNFRAMYWTVSQMLTHHSSNGCDLRPGDMIGTGTISAPDPRHSGCLMEVTGNGRTPLLLPTGETRRFLADGDTVTLAAFCQRDGYRRIGFGTCRGTVLPAIPM